MARMTHLADIADLRHLARRHLPLLLFDFLDGAAGDEVTATRNVEDFRRIGFRPRVGQDVSQVELTTRMLGSERALPFALAPIGFAGLFRPGGEEIAARVAGRFGAPFCLSTNSVSSLEDVARAAPETDLWFQLYFLRDRDWMDKLIDRARDAGYSALCLTMDLPVTGRRDRDVRNGFTLPPRPTLRNAGEFALRLPWLIGATRRRMTFGNFEGSNTSGDFMSLAGYVSSMFDPAATWDDVAAIRDRWQGPMILKGLLHPEDMEHAVALGVQAVSVSNHGGRQLDGAPSAIAALPDMVAAAAGQCEVWLDGGIRRGSDIARARGLGATGVLLGRAWAYGLAAGGEAGVEKALTILRDELKNTLMLLGKRKFSMVDQNDIWLVSELTSKNGGVT